ncbi:MAG: twin-arginine translocation signal domain-containing protein, partial [Mesorhizobium sp.]
MKDMQFNVSRRGFLKVGAALGGGVLAGMPLSQAIWAVEGKVLKVRVPTDYTKLDPGFYNFNQEADVSSCIYSKLIHFKPGSEW